MRVASVPVTLNLLLTPQVQLRRRRLPQPLSRQAKAMAKKVVDRALSSLLLRPLEASWLLPPSPSSYSFTSEGRRTEKVPTQVARIRTAESVAPGRCLWTLRNRGPSTTPTTTKLHHISRLSRTSRPLRVQIICDIPERISKVQTSLPLVLGLPLRVDDRKHHKLAHLGNPGTLYTPTWRTLSQKMASRMSLSFRQRIANEERQYPSPRWAVRSILTTKRPLQHHKAQADPSDRHPHFIHFVRTSRAGQSALHSVKTGCMKVLCSVRTLITFPFSLPSSWLFVLGRTTRCADAELNMHSLPYSTFNLALQLVPPLVLSGCLPSAIIFIFTDSGLNII